MNMPMICVISSISLTLFTLNKCNQEEVVESLEEELQLYNWSYTLHAKISVHQMLLRLIFIEILYKMALRLPDVLRIPIDNFY